MARRLLKRYLPDPDRIKHHKSLQFLGSWIHNPNLWHLNRNSVASAVFIGLFVAYIPLPGQMIIAAFMAIVFHANLPISVSLIWITNPLTMPPLYYLAYKVGAAITGTTTGKFHFELSWEWVTNGLSHNWEPFVIGCLLTGIFFGLVGSTLIRVLWRWYVIRRWHERRLRRSGSRQS